MADLQLVSDDLDLQRQAAIYPNRTKPPLANILDLRLLCLYGLKARRRISEHARSVNTTTTFTRSTTKSWLAGHWPADMNALLECAMEIGQMNFKVMSILDAG